MRTCGCSMSQPLLPSDRIIKSLSDYSVSVTAPHSYADLVNQSQASHRLGKWVSERAAGSFMCWWWRPKFSSAMSSWNIHRSRRGDAGQVCITLNHWTKWHDVCGCGWVRAGVGLSVCVYASVAVLKCVSLEMDSSTSLLWGVLGVLIHILTWIRSISSLVSMVTMLWPPASDKIYFASLIACLSMACYRNALSHMSSFSDATTLCIGYFCEGLAKEHIEPWWAYKCHTSDHNVLSWIWVFFQSPSFPHPTTLFLLVGESSGCITVLVCFYPSGRPLRRSPFTLCCALIGSESAFHFSLDCPCSPHRTSWSLWCQACG